MKKFRVLMGALSFSMVAAIVIACTKEKETKVEQSSNQMTTVLKEDDMSAYLKQFKEKMQSADKGDEALSLEDARWHLEAVLNYSYGDAGNLVTEIQRDTFYYTMPLNGEMVTLVRLNEAFSSLSTDVEKAFAACDLPNKSILALQTQFENETKDDAVMVRVVMDTRGLGPEFNEYGFGPTDYWCEADHGGKCGQYSGQTNIGAVQKLQTKINYRIPHRKCVGIGYYSDIESIHIYDDFIFNYLWDSLAPYGYRVHYYGDLNENYPLCLSPDDLNYYLEEAMKLIDELKPDDKVIIDMTNEYYELVPVSPTYFGYHHYVLNYGVFHCGNANE